MFIYIIILAILTLKSIKIRKEESILSHKDTTTINGIFVICILVSHSTQYFLLSSNVLDRLELSFQNFHNQWVVATFLAFSGYGVMKKLMIDEGSYLAKYPTNRIIRTLIHFDIAVIIYILMNSIIGRKYGFLTVLLSFLGITGIGNSNWYVFVILLMYVFTYVMACVHKNKERELVIGVTILTIVYIIIMSIMGGASRFFSTVLCYPFGMWIAVYKEKIINNIKEKKIQTIFWLIVLLIATYKLRWNDYIMNISSCVFVMIVIWFDTLFEIKSNVLEFLGKHAFSIYILQRIPMILMTEYFPNIIKSNVLGAGVSMIITIVIAIAFDKFLKWFDSKILLHEYKKESI